VILLFCELFKPFPNLIYYLILTMKFFNILTMLSAAAAEAAFNPASEPACYVPQKFVPDASSDNY
jgi:hypothetical protein